jgi:membrane associated rhomboid family serine protease
MLPIKDENYDRPLVPFVNYGLILLNIAVFIYQLSLPSNAALNDFIRQYAAVPADISHGQNLLTLLTSQFMHASFLHIGGNMLYLWIFGDNVEGRLGHIGYLIFYLVSGVIAGLAQVVVDPGSTLPSLGASGAVAGVLGAYLVMFPHARVNTFIFLGIFFFLTRLSAILVIGFWAVLQFFSGFTEITSRTAQTSGQGGVAYFAHIGGFVAGLIVGAIFSRVPPTNPTRYGGYGPPY